MGTLTLLRLFTDIDMILMLIFSVFNGCMGME